MSAHDQAKVAKITQLQNLAQHLLTTTKGEVMTTALNSPLTEVRRYKSARQSIKPVSNFTSIENDHHTLVHQPPELPQDEAFQFNSLEGNFVK